MDLNNTADAQLAALSALVDGDPDLSLAVLRLANSALVDVPSWLSLRVTEAGTEQPITISSPSYSSGTANARSSLRVEVDSAVHGGLSHSIIFLAEQANAFDAFRHFRSTAPDDDAGPDLEVGLPIRRLIVDGDVPRPGILGSAIADNTDTADSERIIDHAIGVLLERGCGDARRELAVLAQAANCSLLQQAHTVLKSLKQWESRAAAGDGTQSHRFWLDEQGMRCTGAHPFVPVGVAHAGSLPFDRRPGGGGGDAESPGSGHHRQGITELPGSAV